MCTNYTHFSLNYKLFHLYEDKKTLLDPNHAYNVILQ